MSVLAGIVSRRPGVPIPPEWCAALRGAISRRRDVQITGCSDERSFLVKMEFGAFDAPAFRRETSGSVAMLAGEPLLSSNDQGSGASRAKDLECLQGAWDADNWDVLKQVQGIFAGVYYRPKTASLFLIADKLSLRPLYYWMNDSWVVFASALRILEAMPFVPKVMDFRAVTEITCFAFPLGARTPYQNIRTIKAAEVVHIEESKCVSQQYWRWDAIPVSRKPEAELLEEAHERFLVSIRRRLHGNRVTTSFLSGGLDSRCVVAALCGEAEKVHTLNCSFPNTQDRVFGAEFARQMGTLHEEEDMIISHPDFFRHISEVWERDENRKQWPPERSRLIWSGDGGSVGMGHVYMTMRTVELLRRGDVDGAVRQFLLEENKHVVCRLLKPEVLMGVSSALEQGMREELDDLHCEDPGRNLYLFLLLNDQRRHLANQYERIDTSHIDYVEPFYDSDFLTTIMSVPLDLCLLHRFYNKWLKLFPVPVSSLPWQSYPGHERCPLPQPAGLISQWSGKQRLFLEQRLRRGLIQKSGVLLADHNFPKPLLRKNYLRFARLLYGWKLQDYGYVLEAAAVYNRYWEVSGGKFALP
jgi:asparagine synthase (glutamine-hydrolysing)